MLRLARIVYLGLVARNGPRGGPPTQKAGGQKQKNQPCRAGLFVGLEGSAEEARITIQGNSERPENIVILAAPSSPIPQTEKVCPHPLVSACGLPGTSTPSVEIFRGMEWNGRRDEGDGNESRND